MESRDRIQKQALQKTLSLRSRPNLSAFPDSLNPVLPALTNKRKATTTVSHVVLETILKIHTQIVKQSAFSQVSMSVLTFFTAITFTLAR
jgi:hypothetical protein